MTTTVEEEALNRTVLQVRLLYCTLQSILFKSDRHCQEICSLLQCSYLCLLLICIEEICRSVSQNRIISHLYQIGSFVIFIRCRFCLKIYLYLYLSLSLSPSPPLIVSLSLSLYLPLYLFLSLSLSLSLCVSLPSSIIADLCDALIFLLS